MRQVQILITVRGDTLQCTIYVKVNSGTHRLCSSCYLPFSSRLSVPLIDEKESHQLIRYHKGPKVISGLSELKLQSSFLSSLHLFGLRLAWGKGSKPQIPEKTTKDGCFVFMTKLKIAASTNRGPEANGPRKCLV